VYIQEIILEIYGCLPVPSLSYPLALFTNIPCDSKGFNPQQTAFAIKCYKLHLRIGLPSEWCSWQLRRLPQRLRWLSEPLRSAPGPPQHRKLFYCSRVSNLISKIIIYSFLIILTSLSFSLYLIEFIAQIYREFQ
jgi:hypothetical protein